MHNIDGKPAVHIYETHANPAYLLEICAGLEEEGIPYAIGNINHGDVKALAFEAASHSRLRVGIGITCDEAALQIRNCPADKPVFIFNIEPSLANSQLRKLGTNAAKAVKGGVFV